MTPCSAAAGGSFSSRESSRSAALRACSGSSKVWSSSTAPVALLADSALDYLFGIFEDPTGAMLAVMKAQPRAAGH